MVSHYNVIANVLQLTTHDSGDRKQLGIDTQVALGVLPFSHIYGLTIVSILGPYRGDQVVVLPKFDFDQFLNAIQTYKLEQLFLVPPMLITIMGNKDKVAKYDLSSVRWIYCGAAPLGEEVIGGILTMFPKWHIAQAYGTY